MLTTQTQSQNAELLSKPAFTIRPARFPDDKPHILSLLRAFVAWMPQPPEFKTKYLALFEEEVESLPGPYAPEFGGGLWLAFLPSLANGEHEGRQEGKAVGMVCLKSLIMKRSIGQSLPLNEAAELEDAVTDLLKDETRLKEGGKRRKKSCEPKRLFTTVETRGLGVGKRLMEIVIEEARRFGYEEMLLETVEKAVEAIKLYERFGFEKCADYSEEEGDWYCMRKDLTK